MKGQPILALQTAATSLECTRVTQLLPPRFVARRQTRRVFCLWLFVVLSCLSALIGVLMPVWFRGQRIRAQNQQVFSEAQPLKDLRVRTQVIQLDNERQSQWTRWVQSAKPDDSLLQTMATVAAATKPEDSGIEIESLAIQLPLEYPESFPNPPKWAVPQLSIHAKVQDGIIARAWLERLGASDRIGDVGSKLVPGSWKGGTIQVNAKPFATCVLP